MYAYPDSLASLTFSVFLLLLPSRMKQRVFSVFEICVRTLVDDSVLFFLDKK